MDYQLLFNEVSQPQYSGMTDAEIAATLNAQTPVRRHVPARDLIATAVLNGVYAAIDAGSDSENAQMRGLCRSVLAILHLSDQTVNLDDPRVAQMFGALRQYGVITAQQAAQIDALANAVQPSRAEALGLGIVTEDNVAAARGWQAAQEAEQARLAAYRQLRHRLTNGQMAAFAWLQTQQDSGADAPDWPAVLARL